MNCKNCGQQLDGKYCNHCGQKANVGRINLPNFLSEISESIFQVNRGFFFTLKELFMRPGKSIGEFLEGQRKYHFKPIAYVLTLSTLYFLITQIIAQNTWMDDIISGFVEGAMQIKSDAQIPPILNWFANNFAYSTLLLLPVFSLASYWAFLHYGKNYLEHIVINSYITGHQAIFYAVFALIGTVIKSEVFEALPVLTAIGYTFWVFLQLFKEGSTLSIVLRSIFTYVLYLILSTLLLMIALAISGV